METLNKEVEHRQETAQRDREDMRSKRKTNPLRESLHDVSLATELVLGQVMAGGPISSKAELMDRLNRLHNRPVGGTRALDESTFPERWRAAIDAEVEHFQGLAIP